MGSCLSVAAPVIGAAGSLIGGSKQAKGAEQGAAIQKEMFDKVQQNLQPYMNFGAGVLPTYAALLGVPFVGNSPAVSNSLTSSTALTPSNAGSPAYGAPIPKLYGKGTMTSSDPNYAAHYNELYGAPQTSAASPAGTSATPASAITPDTIQSALENLPGYQFAKYQGLKGVQNGYAAKGLGSSGAALKGAASYATGLADQTYGEQLNRILQAASLGANAAAGFGNTATNAGQGIGQSYQNAGVYQGNAINAAGNAFAQNQLMNRGMYGATDPTPDIQRTIAANPSYF